ncbi:MAG: hypothetical protein Q9174_007001 [Haloplaca sp. 1 TL-2023]
MEKMKISVFIQKRYQVFDSSGRLPFSIVFGLCRRSSTDTDPRPLVLETAGSVFDVPYALAHGLLTLHIETPESANRWTKVNTSGLVIGETRTTDYITLPSPVDRSKLWRDALTAYLCPLDFADGLAAVLEVGTIYRINLASEDLGVKRWVYGEEHHVKDSAEASSHEQSGTTLIKSNKAGGNATFKVVQDLPWPPIMKIGLRTYVSSPTPDDNPGSPTANGRQLMEVSIVNQGFEPITVQISGQQGFLLPWGPLQPEEDIDTKRTRIIDPALQGPPIASLRVIDTVTRQLVRGDEKIPFSCTLTKPGAVFRPKVEDLITLRPGEPHLKQFDIETVMKGLADGQYRIRLQPRGCSWWAAKIETLIGEDGRMSKQFCGRLKPPLMIESQDELEVRLENGRIDCRT